MAFWCLALLTLRGCKTRTYHFAFLLELVCCCLWIPPILVFAGRLNDPSYEPADRITVVTLAFCGLNM